MKTVYLITNSEILNNAFVYQQTNQKILLKEQILSCTGEEKALKIASKVELKSLDAIYSSSYIACISTSKYIARANNKKIYIDDAFNDREIGNLKDITISEFNYHSLLNFDYKLIYGESINDVKRRFSQSLKKILDTKLNNIAIVSHKESILAVLLNWCQLGFNYENEPILSFNEEIIHDGEWNLPEIFKLTFNEEKTLIGLSNITFNE